MYIVLFLIIDQVAKMLVKAQLQPVSFVNIINNVISFEYVENKGAAWGILSGKSVLLISVTLVLTIVLVVGYYLLIKKKGYKLLNLGTELVIAGAIGNLIDRIFRGYVIDFIKLEFINFPVFNIADMLINIGAFIIVIYLCLTDETKTKN